MILNIKIKLIIILILYYNSTYDWIYTGNIYIIHSIKYDMIYIIIINVINLLCLDILFLIVLIYHIYNIITRYNIFIF
jgi:hypothetical protein